MRPVLALSLFLIVLAGGCGVGAELLNGEYLQITATPIAGPGEVPALNPVATASSTPELLAAQTTDSTVQPIGEPLSASEFNSPEAIADPIDLSLHTLELFDGLLLSVSAPVTFDGGGEGSNSPVVGVANGRAWMLKGRWCGWEYDRALNAFDGSFLFESDSVFVCKAGERYRSASWEGRPLATGHIEDRRFALVAGHDLLYLDLDTLKFEPFFELNEQDGFPISASSNDGRWVVVFSLLEGDQEQQASRRIAFLDLDGSVIAEENNPFPEFGVGFGPRAAALTPDGQTLVFSADEEDGSSTLVMWDLILGQETGRLPILGPFVPGDDPYGWGREYVTSLDVSNDHILVNVSIAAPEHRPSRALVVDFAGNVIDLSAQSELAVYGAAFLETEALPYTP